MEDKLDGTIKEIISNLFGVPLEDLDDSSSPEQISNWDSGEHLNLVSSLEQRFDISIDIDDYTEMDSLGKIKDVIRKYIA